MPRITCRQPSTGKPLNLAVAGVGTAWATLAEAPDFSVPDPNTEFATRDPLDSGRAIRPGQVFFLTPIVVTNKTATARWIEAQYLNEAGTATLFARIVVPGLTAATIPVQGRSLTKRVAAGANGERLQVRAEAGGALDVTLAASERLSAEHIGVV